jgi:hypothetical protein
LVKPIRPSNVTAKAFRAGFQRVIQRARPACGVEADGQVQAFHGVKGANIDVAGHAAAG